MIRENKELTDEAERARALDESGLGIMIAGYEPGETLFLAAHKPDPLIIHPKLGVPEADSIMVLRHAGETSVWRVWGTEESRRNLADELRAKLKAMEKK